ncbi:kinase-like domain-containing protein [Podospora australis]|uniref:non-specific serine/threonine protein kinase n=1 Tax=Podospora australis TaxID=1536484 RepID=A0AAN6WY58_9PEZI|nr:kinase-like domain-containing protein [Podospora australis]
MAPSEIDFPAVAAQPAAQHVDDTTNVRLQSWVREIDNLDDELYQRTETVLGKGTCGKVIVVTRRRDGKQLACKIQNMRTENFSRDDWIQRQPHRMWQEVNIWHEACQGTQHVARMEDVAYNIRRRELYIYSELMAGGDLFRFVDKCRRSEDPLFLHPLIMLWLGHQLAKGMLEIHAKEIFHRDMKADNVLLRHPITLEMNHSLWAAQSAAGLTDELRPSFKSLSRSSQPAARALFTDGITAPEVVADRMKQSTKADIYSVGVLLKDAATLGSERVDLRSAYHYPKVLRDAIEFCCHPDPSRRPTAEVLVDAFQDALLEEWRNSVLGREAPAGQVAEGETYLPRPSFLPPLIVLGTPIPDSPPATPPTLPQQQQEKRATTVKTKIRFVNFKRKRQESEAEEPQRPPLAPVIRLSTPLPDSPPAVLPSPPHRPAAKKRCPRRRRRRRRRFSGLSRIESESRLGRESRD